MSTPYSHPLAQTGGGFGVSAFLQFQACYVGQLLVFEESERCLSQLLGITVSGRQVQRMCEYYGTVLESRQDASILVGETSEVFAGKEMERHYALMDGSFYMTREEDPWMEAKLARVFNARDCMDHGGNLERGWIRQSQYLPHLGNSKDFLVKLDYLIHSLKNIVLIADGARWIWDWVEANHPEALQILDFFHAMEHLWQFARAWYKDESEQKTWVEGRKKLLLDDGVAQLVAELEAMPPPVSKAAGDERQNLITYYRKNIKRMMYKTFYDHGLMIGSGAMESANKNILQKRLKLSGQRWSTTGWQAVANLRALDKSGHWKVMEQLTRGNLAA